jgi:hypothetical protein
VGEALEKKMARWGARIVLLEMATRVTRVILEKKRKFSYRFILTWDNPNV